MVRGLDLFREYFKDFTGSYIIIGGTACDIIIEEAQFIPRATVDIDIILIIEALNIDFVKRFWEFINEGKYITRQKNKEHRKCYRFSDPEFINFPIQIELFSRVPDLMDLDKETHLTPIPTDDDLSSLSAILMNDEYYHFTIEHSTKKEDYLLANPEALICLKAIAYLDNKKRKEEGMNISKRDLIKHKNDVFRLALFLTPENVFKLPASIKTDMQIFADTVKNDLPDKAIFRAMRAGNINPDELFKQILKIFELHD